MHDILSRTSTIQKRVSGWTPPPRDISLWCKLSIEKNLTSLGGPIRSPSPYWVGGRGGGTDAMPSITKNGHNKCRILICWLMAFSHLNTWPDLKMLAILLFRIPVRECARTLWMVAPFWGRGDRIPKAGTRSVSWAQTRKGTRRDRMRRQLEVKEDDPFMASRCQHAQSKWCAQLRRNKWTCRWYCIHCTVFDELIVFIVSGK
jgi:hypothetical protein